MRSMLMPALPSLALVSQLLMLAVAIGIIGLAKAAGISQGYSNSSKPKFGLHCLCRMGRYREWCGEVSKYQKDPGAR